VLTKYAQDISSYIKFLNFNNYLNTAYRTQLFIKMTDFTQKVVVRNKQYWVQRIKCVGWCEFVFVCVFVFVLKRLNTGIKKNIKI